MSSPYVGECRLVGFNFAPVDWAICQGQILAISQNDTLFNLIGTAFGGDGQNTFGLPNLQGRAPVHQGSGMVYGQIGGQETVTLTTAQIPSHNHALMASSVNGTATNITGAVLAVCPTAVYAANPNPTATMNANAVSNAGGSGPGVAVPHSNLQPFLVLNWIISLFGIYPSQN